MNVELPVTDDACLFHGPRLVFTVAPDAVAVCRGFILDYNDDDDFILIRSSPDLN